MKLYLKDSLKLATGPFKILFDKLRSGKDEEEKTIKPNEIRVDPTAGIPRQDKLDDSSS